MLTQSEIDALLSGAIELEGHDGQERVNLADLMDQPGGSSPREVDPDRKIQAYNFWSPNRFSKEQMRAVELVHEDLAERLMTSLPTFLRISLRPRLVHTEQGRFHDFVKDVPANSLFHLVTLAPLPGQMIMTISPNVSYMILEQRLGGRIEGQSKERPLTDIDQSLLKGLVEHMLTDLKGAWSKVVSIEPQLDDSTTNPNWVQMLMGNEKVMLLTFELTIQGTTGIMNIYIPFGMLKPIANELNPHVWISGRKERQVDPQARQTLIQGLGNVHLPVKVLLGEAQLTLNEVLNLAVDDIIQLNTEISQSLVMQIVDQPLFKVQIGKMGSHIAVKVAASARDGQEDSKSQ
ncbi:MAG: flagellar motor switch protein FliM [Chloroflexi bacterium]|nr:flagellar motor switch protein FliM [Anaerolineaceae bacterium]NMB90551.1 flagellar motor switch protein FliM [Chloroflexota bacterium]